VNVLIQNSWLVVYHWQQEWVAVNVEVLVNQIQLVLFAIIPKDVLLLVGIHKFYGLLPDQVVDMSFAVGVHEAIVAYPEATRDDILELVLELEGVFKTIVVIFLVCLLD